MPVPRTKGTRYSDKGNASLGRRVTVPRPRDARPSKRCRRPSVKGARSAEKGYRTNRPSRKALPVPPKRGCPPLGKRLSVHRKLGARPSENGHAATRERGCPSLGKGHPALGKWHPGGRPSVMAYPSLGNGGAVLRKKKCPCLGYRGTPPWKHGWASPGNGVPVERARSTRPSDQGVRPA